MTGPALRYGHPGGSLAQWSTLRDPGDTNGLLRLILKILHDHSMYNPIISKVYGTWGHAGF